MTEPASSPYSEPHAGASPQKVTPERHPSPSWSADDLIPLGSAGLGLAPVPLVRLLAGTMPDLTASRRGVLRLPGEPLSNHRTDEIVADAVSGLADAAQSRARDVEESCFWAKVDARRASKSPDEPRFFEDLADALAGCGVPAERIAALMAEPNVGQVEEAVAELLAAADFWAGVLAASAAALRRRPAYAARVRRALAEARSQPESTQALAARLFETLGPGFHSRPVIIGAATVQGRELLEAVGLLDPVVGDRLGTRPRPWRVRKGLPGALFPDRLPFDASIG